MAVPAGSIAEVKREVISRAGRYKIVADNSHVKEVVVGEGELRRRYVVCYNPEQAEREAKHREEVLAELDERLAEHPKRDAKAAWAAEFRASGRFGRYLDVDAKGRLVLDKKAVREAERLDGKWVLITNDDTLPALDAAAHTADTLRASGCPQVVAPLADGSGIPGAVAFRLSDDGPERPDPTYLVVQYAPAAHEAGHMFGLPDEYPVDWSPFEAIGADLQWGRFEAMARAAGTAPPPPATDTSSLMSMGPDVLPCHYAMFHEALARMTAAFLAPSEWRMEPSPTCRAARRPPVYAPFSAQGAEVE